MCAILFARKWILSKMSSSSLDSASSCPQDSARPFKKGVAHQRCGVGPGIRPDVWRLAGRIQPNARPVARPYGRRRRPCRQRRRKKSIWSRRPCLAASIKCCGRPFSGGGVWGSLRPQPKFGGSGGQRPPAKTEFFFERKGSQYRLDFYYFNVTFLSSNFLMQGWLVMSNYCPEWILGVAVGVSVGDALTDST